MPGAGLESRSAGLPGLRSHLWPEWGRIYFLAHMAVRRFPFLLGCETEGLTFLEDVGQRASSAPGHVGFADMTTGFLTARKEASPWKTGVTIVHNMITDMTFYCLYRPEWVEASHGSHACSRGRTSQRCDHQETMGTSSLSATLVS